MPNTKLTIIRLLVALLFVGVPLSRAEVRHLPAPSAKGTISEGQAYSIILQAMALRENVLHAANLAPEDERQAYAVVLTFEKRFGQLGAALDSGTLTSRQFAAKRDELTRTTSKNYEPR